MNRSSSLRVRVLLLAIVAIAWLATRDSAVEADPRPTAALQASVPASTAGGKADVDASR